MSSRQEEKARARAEREERERREASAEQRRKRLMQLGGALAVAAVVVIGLIIWLGQKQKPNASTGAAVAGISDSRAMLQGIQQHGSTLGDPTAPLVVTEFADLQCPFCKEYTLNVLPQVIQDYVRTRKVRLDLRLERFIGPQSNPAAHAAQAAATQNRMWNFIDIFYRNQGEENSGYVTPTFLSRIGTAAGVPAKLVVAGSTSAKYEPAIKLAETQAQAAGLTSTPSFLIGPKAGQGKQLNLSSLDFASFKAAIDPQLKQ